MRSRGGGGTIIRSPTAPVAPTPVFEETGSDFRDNDYTHLSSGVLARELTKEQQLPLTLRTSMVTALEEASDFGGEPPS